MPIHCPHHTVVAWTTDAKCSWCEIERLQTELAGARNQLRVMAVLTDAKPTNNAVEPSEVVLKPCEIVREPDDYTVQCYCGWSGKVSQLMSLPKFKHGCPVCSAEFKPFALKS